MNKNAKLLNSLLSMGNMPSKPTDKVPPKNKKVVKKKKKVPKAMPGMMMTKKGKC